MKISVFIRNRKALAGICVLIALIGGFLFLRSPYVSNALKMRILTEAYNLTGRQVMAGQIYLNALPPFVGINDVRAIDDKGDVILSAERVKAYIGFSDILKRRIIIDRLVVVKPVISADKSELDSIVNKIKGHGSEPQGRGRKLFEVRTKAVNITDGDIEIRDEGAGSLFKSTSADLELLFRGSTEIALNVGDMFYTRDGWHDLSGAVKARATYLDGRATIKSLEVRSFGSTLKADGRVESRDDPSTARLGVKLELIADTLKEILGITKHPEGTILAEGSLVYPGDPRDIALDLKLSGDFHLDTLLESIHAEPQDHQLTGHIYFNGELSGPLTDLRGRADGRMTDSDIFGAFIDEVTCEVRFGDGLLSFHSAEGRIYNGHARAEVGIGIPHVNPFYVHVWFEDADSGPLLKLISLDHLGLADGKVTGEVHSDGMEFDPSGVFHYKSRGDAPGPVGRIREARGAYEMREGIVHLADTNLYSEASHMSFGGTLNTHDKNMDFSGFLVSSNIKRVISTLYTRLGGGMKFDGTVKGTLDDPLVEGSLTLLNARIDDYYVIGDVNTKFSYWKNLLRIDGARAVAENVEHTLNGTISFPDARKMLELDSATFDMTASLYNGRLHNLLRVLGFDEDIEGTTHTALTIKGNWRKPLFVGAAHVNDASLFGQSVAEASFGYTFDNGEFKVFDGILKDAGSTARVSGMLAMDGSFDFKASSDRLQLSRFLPKKYPFEYAMKAEAEGSGTFKYPEINLKAELSEGIYENTPLGDGELVAALVGSDLSVKATLMDERVSLVGSMNTRGDLPWHADLRVDYGRYEAALMPFLKKRPEDLALALEGEVELQGSRGGFKASASLSQLGLSMYGQNFSNRDKATFAIDGGKISISSLKLRGENAAFDVYGSVNAGESYDLEFTGTSSLAPLNLATSALSEIKGDSEFAINLKGPWESPDITGHVMVKDTTVSLKSLTQKITDINGTLYLEGRRAVIENFTGNIGGGTVKLAGSAELKGLGVGSMSLESQINDVTLYIVKGFDVNLGGLLLVTGNLDTQNINGEVWVNKASYTKRVEWKTWLMSGSDIRGISTLGGSDGTRLNIRVYGANNIRIDNNIARAPVELDLFVRGSMAYPQLYGRMSSTGGQVYFRNSEFTILRATADYSEARGSSPYVEVLAETTIKSHHIWMNLEGELQQMDLALSSEPPLDDVDIMSLLTLGEFGDSLAGLESGIGAAEATSILTGSIQDTLEERVKLVTGLDRLQIDPYVSSSTDTVAPRITVGKRLLGERLYVTYTSMLGSSLDQEIKLEYRLGSNVSLVGWQDSTGSIGGDIKFRFRFK